jgi:transcriptional regulator with XRE-family HTH domain
MKHEEVLERLRQDPEYVAAEKELQPILDIAEDVLRLRLEKGWTQSELARRAGTCQANISKLENGLSNPTLEFLGRVAQALQTDLTVHIGPEQQPETTRVIVRQEMRVVQPEELWGGKPSRHASPTQWIGFESETKYLNQTDFYEAA